MILRAGLLLFIFIITLPSIVTAEDKLSVVAASDHIDITVGFTGSSIEIFGYRKDLETDIMVVVEGPRKDITIWKKKRFFGAWKNRYSVTYHDIPVYYNYAVSADDTDGKTKSEMDALGIGHSALLTTIKKKYSKRVKNKVPSFNNALLNQKKEEGTFFDEPVQFTFFNDHFFRLSFPISAGSSIGQYKVLSYLVKGGDVIEQEESQLKVGQVGINAFTNSAAKNHSLLYAFMCISMAVLAGWLVNIIKVRL